MKIEVGRIVKRICPRCDHALDGDGIERACPKCGAGLVEVRGDHDPLIGTKIDSRFEIRARLGQGGMGTVYRAYQRSVDREVAIKLIDPSYARDPMAVRRFEREAQLASRLSHPNTVSVFDFGNTEGRLFIAMELIRGRTLHKVLRTDGTFSVDRAVRVGVQICDALEAAHKLGIVHRDLKLENVMVLDDPPGRDLVKVLDFGLAKQLGDIDVKGTGHGIVVGTPRYLAPEAVTGAAMAPAADLYALGVVLAELVTGRPLWDGDNLADLLVMKLSPRSAIAKVPSALHPIVAALIDPKPERRPSAASTRERLTAIDEEAVPKASAMLTPSDLKHTVPGRAGRPSAPPPVTAPTKRSVPAWERWVLVGLIVGPIVMAGVQAGRWFGGSNVDAPTSRHHETVVIHVDTHPAGAEIIWNGAASGSAPFDITVPHTNDSLTVEAWLGKSHETMSLTADHSASIKLVLPDDAAPPHDCAQHLVDPDDDRCSAQFCRHHHDEPACVAPTHDGNPWTGAPDSHAFDPIPPLGANPADAHPKPPTKPPSSVPILAPPHGTLPPTVPHADMVAVRIDSSPSGADVFFGAKLLGRAPVDVTVPLGDQPLTYDVWLGSSNQRAKVTPDHKTLMQLVVTFPADAAPPHDCAVHLVDPKDERCRAQFCRHHPDDSECNTRLVRPN